jgi:hypothetical protein
MKVEKNHLIVDSNKFSFWRRNFDGFLTAERNFVSGNEEKASYRT